MLRVLVVDDDYTSAHSLASHLNASGMEVALAHTSLEAEELLRHAKTPFDIALLDVMLPPTAESIGLHVEGLNLAERLRRASPTTHLVAISAYMPPDRIEALSGAFDECLSRSVSVQDIVELIRQLTGSRNIKRSPKIFIVHGHDESAKLSLKNYLQNTLGIGEPIILHEQPSHGRTILDKFEQSAREADLAFVLLTPDDVGATASDPNATKRRARQNVILELGFFLGRLPRGRTVLLHKGPIEIPSDIAGMVYIDISLGIEAAWETIRREVAPWLH